MGLKDTRTGRRIWGTVHMQKQQLWQAGNMSAECRHGDMASGPHGVFAQLKSRVWVYQQSSVQGSQYMFAGMLVPKAGQGTHCNAKSKLRPPVLLAVKRATCNTSIDATSCKAAQAHLGTSMAAKHLGSPRAPLPGLSLGVEGQAQAVEHLIQHMHAQRMSLGQKASVDMYCLARPVNVLTVVMQLRNRVACEGLHSTHVHK